MSKSKELIPKIVDASNKEEAIKVLHDVLQALYLTNNYTDIVKLKDDFTEQKEKYNRITNEYDVEEKDLALMIETRTRLNFLYRDISDRFSFDINRLKIFFEEYKTSVRAESMKNLKSDTEIQELFNAKSTSALRDIVGISSKYQEYIANASISYGLWQELNNVLNSIRMFIDLLASQIKHEQLILQKDVK
jgi:hypothetical protein